MSGRMFHCDTCNSSMTGQANYNDHIKGKKHLRKVKLLVHEANAAPATSTISGQLKQHETADGYGGKFVKPNSQCQGGPDQVSNDTVPSSSSSSSSFSVNQQTMQAPPLPPVIQSRQPQTPNNSQLLGTSNQDPVMSAVKANLLGKLPLKKESYEGRCDVCGVDYTSASHEEQHLSGKKHLKKMEASQGNVNSATLFCSFCNVKVNSVEQMEQHRAGTSHMKKVNMARKTQQDGGSPAKKTFVPSSETEAYIPPPPTSFPILPPLSYDK